MIGLAGIRRGISESRGCIPNVSLGTRQSTFDLRLGTSYSPRLGDLEATPRLEPAPGPTHGGDFGTTSTEAGI